MNELWIAVAGIAGTLIAGFGATILQGHQQERAWRRDQQFTLYRELAAEAFKRLEWDKDWRGYEPPRAEGDPGSLGYRREIRTMSSDELAQKSAEVRMLAAPLVATAWATYAERVEVVNDGYYWEPDDGPGKQAKDAMVQAAEQVLRATREAFASS